MKSMLKKMSLIITVILSFGLLSCSKPEVKNEFGWFTNYDACLESAKKSNKKAFLLITREESDGLTKNLNQKVFHTEEFINKFSAEYEFCQIDVSPELFAKANPKKDADKQIKKESGKYKKLLEHRMRVVTTHDVKATPSLYIVTKDGYVLFDIAYLPVNTVSEFDELIKSYSQTIETIEKLIDNVEQSSGLEKVKSIDELYESVKVDYRYQMTNLMREVLKLDKKNETGLLGKYILAIATSDAMDAYIARKPNSVSGIYEKAAKNSVLNTAQKQQAYYAAAYVLGSNMPTPEQTVKIIDLLEKTISVDANSEIGKHCAELLVKYKDFQKRQQEKEKKLKEEAKSESEADTENAQKADSGN